MKTYILVFSDVSGHISTTEQTLNANNLQQASIRALREVWAMHHKRPEIVRAIIFRRDGGALFTASILDKE